MIGTLAGFTGAQMLLAFFGNQSILNFYGFVPVALGGMGSNRGALIGGLALGLFQQAANFLVGGIFAAVAVFAVFIVVLAGLGGLFLADPAVLPSLPKPGDPMAVALLCVGAVFFAVVAWRATRTFARCPGSV